MYIPKEPIYNESIVEKIDSSEEWIKKNIGIDCRYYVSPEDSASDISIKAAEACLANSDSSADDLDAIILACGNADHIGNSTATLIKRGLQIDRCATFDIICGCAGFIYALSIAKAYIESHTYRRILVIGTEILSKIMDPYDRNTVPFFGDGSGALLLEATEDEHGFLNCFLSADGSGSHVISRTAGGTKRPITADAIMSQADRLRMDPKAVWRFFTHAFNHAVNSVVEASDLKLEDLKYIISHQATARIIEYSMKKLKLPMDKTHINIDRYGNTSCASIPILMHELLTKRCFEKGDIVCFVGFGGGFSYGSALYQF